MTRRRECAAHACDDCSIWDLCPDYEDSATRTVAKPGNTRLVVYIAGPISDQDFVAGLQNLARFFHAETTLIKHGFSPINPAADLIAALHAGDFTYRDYLGKDEPLVKRSDALLLLPGWSESMGATAEVSWALQADVPCFTSMSDLEEYRESLTAAGDVSRS